MKAIEIYEAEDGKRFDSEVECAEYEAKMRAQKFADTAFLYDGYGNPLELTESNFENAYYVVADTPEAIRFMANEFLYTSGPWDIFGANSPGCWAYVGNEWHCADEILEMTRIIKKIS